MITEFKIFENMKIVGPLYHGSRYSFDNFKQDVEESDGHLISYLGNHFTPSIKIARRFARKPDFMLYTVEINVNSTLKITEGNLVREMLKWGYKKKYFDYKEKDIKELISLPYTSISGIGNSITDELLDNDIVRKFTPHFMLAENYKKDILEKKYDSIQYLNEIETDELSTRYDWIIFDPKNIKILNKEKIEK